MEEGNIVELIEKRKKEGKREKKKKKYVAIGELKVSIRYRILMARERDRGDRSLLFHS